LFYAIGTLTFSGIYVTRDTMDFTTVADKLSSAQILQVFADSQNATRVTTCRSGRALKNWKLKAFTGGEQKSRRSVSGKRTTDVVQVTITARKLL